jgi:hypothetical protein
MEIRDLQTCYEELKHAIFKHLENLEIKEGSHHMRKVFEEIVDKYKKIGANSRCKG